MSLFKSRLFRILLFALAFGCAAQAAKAQDPARVDPEHYKVLYEDDHVRVMSYDDEPGHFVPKHSHPNYAVYVLAPATRQFYSADCALKPAPPSVLLKPGPPFLKTPVTHCERNNGKTDTHLVIVEFKEAAKQPRAAGARRRRLGRPVRRAPR